MTKNQAIKNFSVGPRTQSIPEFAYKGLGSRWFYLRLFSVSPYKNKPHIITVYCQIIHQTFDRDLNWINQFAYVEDYESYNNGKYRTGGGNPSVLVDDLKEAYRIANTRFEKISGIWKVLEDKKAIERFAVSDL
jgi:hypothetical protein